MNRIDKKFRELKEQGRKAFIAYITAGDPDVKTTETLIARLSSVGVDILELGVPFSDPMADGLTNQRAAERALEKGITLKKVLEITKCARELSCLPIVLFTYLNPVYRYGLSDFARNAGNAGVDGILILDLPVEESFEYRRAFAEHGIEMIYLISPTSTDKRIKLVSRNARGFIYYVSRTGVTGVRESVENDVKPMVEKIKQFTKLPVAVGFGISTPLHVKKVAEFADGVVVGSAIVDCIEKNLKSRDLVNRVCGFVRSLTGAL